MTLAVFLLLAWLPSFHPDAGTATDRCLDAVVPFYLQFRGFDVVGEYDVGLDGSIEESRIMRKGSCNPGHPTGWRGCLGSSYLGSFDTVEAQTVGATWRSSAGNICGVPWGVSVSCSPFEAESRIHLDRQWWTIHHRRFGAGRECPELPPAVVPTVFADGFESGDSSSWSLAVGICPWCIFADSFESGDTRAWND